jgi:hypothetical protein
MPKKKKPQERPTGQRAAQPPNYLTKFVPQWSTPQWQDANLWRYAVRQQPVCIVCRDTLISFLLGREWQIRAKDPNQNETFKTDIDYYIELLETSGGMDFDTKLDLLSQDILDTPFGGAFEVGRLGDVPDGRVAWIDHIDAATLFPTYDFNFPVAQRVDSITHPPILFPRHAINRAMMTPRTEWRRKGWGMAPPEKIYLALDLLYRGDRYYANLLLDTPEAGVLDLLDMDKASALEWLESFQTLFTGTDAFKVPVLYEHTIPAKYIPFGRPPGELLFDNVTFKYAQIVCAGYGLKISDIGLSADEARTLAGIIRAERQTRRTGLASLSTKVAGWLNRLLPPFLVFEWIEQDDESMIARGRARLANFQAYGEAREKNMLHLEEIRAQIASDGLLDIQIDPDDVEGLEMMEGVGLLPPRTDRDRVPPSQGGEGELTFPRKSSLVLLADTSKAVISRASPPRLRRLVKVIAKELFPALSETFKELTIDDAQVWADAMVANSFGFRDTYDIGEAAEKAIEKKKGELNKHLVVDKWWSIKDLAGESGFLETLSETYLLGYSLAHQYVSQILYEEGKIDDLIEIKPRDADLDSIDSSIVSLVELADNASPGLVKAVILAAVCRAFVIPTVFEAIRTGVSVEDLLEDEDFMDAVTEEATAGIAASFSGRVQVLSDFVSDDVVTKATRAFFKKLGLKEGDWERKDGKLIVDRAKLFKIADKKEFTL